MHHIWRQEVDELKVTFLTTAISPDALLPTYDVALCSWNEHLYNCTQALVVLDNLHYLLTPFKEALTLYLLLWAQTYMGIFLNFQKGWNIYCINGEIWYTGVNIICFFIIEHPLFQRKAGIVYLGMHSPYFESMGSVWDDTPRSRGDPALSQIIHQILLLMAVSSGVGIWSKLMNSERTSDPTYPFDIDLKKYDARTL